MFPYRVLPAPVAQVCFVVSEVPTGLALRPMFLHNPPLPFIKNIYEALFFNTALKTVLLCKVVIVRSVSPTVPETSGSALTGGSGSEVGAYWWRHL